MVAGNAFSQTVILTVDGINATAVTLIVLTVSQPPVVLATVSMREPEIGRTSCRVRAENAVSEAAILTVEVNNGTAVTLIVSAVSHPPFVLDSVSVRYSAALNI